MKLVVRKKVVFDTDEGTVLSQDEEIIETLAMTLFADREGRFFLLRESICRGDLVKEELMQLARMQAEAWLEFRGKSEEEIRHLLGEDPSA